MLNLAQNVLNWQHCFSFIVPDITKVIAPAMKEEGYIRLQMLALNRPINRCFTKLLVILIRYCCPEKKKLVTALISTVSIVRATGEVIYDELKKVVESMNIKLSDCISLSNDGASANIGEHNSV